MDTIRQPCPQCSSTLELPSSAMGRMARCPACQHTFRVHTDQAPSASQESPSAGQPNPSAGENYNYSSEVGQPTKPVDYASNPYTQTGSPQPTSPDNPYAFSPGMGSYEALQVGKAPIVVRTASIDRIVSAATSIFSARWQPLVLSGLVYYIGVIVVGMINIGVNMAIQAADLEFGPIILFAFTTFISLFNWYISLGLINVALMAARGQETGPAKVFIGPSLFARLMVPIIVLSIIGASPGLLLLVNEAAADEFAGAMLTLVGSAFVGIATALVLWTIWPMFFLIIDERNESGSTLSLGFKIGTSNLLNGFLMILIAAVLGIAATFTCTIGTIVTQPLMMLIGCVAYLMMTSQPVSDPGVTPYQTPKYGN